MATHFSAIYDAFLARITADDWMLEADAEIVERDWQQLLDIAIFRFKFPRVELVKIQIEPGAEDPHEEWGFAADLNQDDIQMLALYMKHEWLKRCIANWENIGTLYAD